MKAVVVKPPGAGVWIKEVQDPGDPQGRVRIRTLETGICGTDREIVNGRRLTTSPPPGREELILGHEAIGVGEEGDGIFREGDLVMPVNRRPCGKCLNCKAGRPDYCETGQFVQAGANSLDGFMREYWNDEPKYLVKVPPAVREFAILAQPLADVEKSVEEILTVQRRLIWNCEDGTLSCRKALVIGTGTTGLLFALLLKTEGMEVWVSNRREPREWEAKVFQEVGLNFLNSSKGYGGESFDLIVEASGSTAAVVGEALSSLRRNGVLGLFSFPREESFSLDHRGVQTFVMRANAIVGLVNGQKPHFQRAMVHLSAWNSIWPNAVRSMITKVVSVRDEGEVIRVLREKVRGEIKVKIDWT